jgi:hypothetical protein
LKSTRDAELKIQTPLAAKPPLKSRGRVAVEEMGRTCQNTGNSAQAACPATGQTACFKNRPISFAVANSNHFSAKRIFAHAAG